MVNAITTCLLFRAVYTNISLALPQSHTIVKKLFSGSSKELSLIQKQITEMEICLLNQWEMVEEALHEGNVHEASIAALKYQSDLEYYFKLNSGMVKLYENDIEKLKMRQSEDRVSTSQKEQILNNVKELERLCSIGL